MLRRLPWRAVGRIAVPGRLVEMQSANAPSPWLFAPDRCRVCARGAFYWHATAGCTQIDRF